MKIAKVYSHLNGLEWLCHHHPGVWQEIQEVIAGIDAEACKTKVSKEKTMFGRLVYSPPALNAKFKEALEPLGWRDRKIYYWVTEDHELIRKTLSLNEKDQREAIKAEGKTPIRSYNQTDYEKNKIAIEVQFGKYSFISYDLFVKHLFFFAEHHIDLGIEILPMKAMQAKMSSGPGYLEGALYDLVRQGRAVPAVPLVLIGVVPDELDEAAEQQIIEETNEIDDSAKVALEEERLKD